MKGFGPGGQKTNKSNNCVILTHLPTMETVKCHDAREQATNRAIARKILYERLDLFLNPDSSTVSVRVMKKQRAKSKAIQRRKKRETDKDDMQLEPQREEAKALAKPGSNALAKMEVVDKVPIVSKAIKVKKGKDGKDEKPEKQ